MIRTKWLLAAFILATAALNWYTNTYVLTRELYHQLLGAQMELARIDANFDFVQRFALWGYLMVPLTVVARIVIVSLVIQLFLVLFTLEYPFASVMRAVTVAYPATLFTSVLNTVFLATRDADSVSLATLKVVPGSLSSFLLPDADATGAIYGLLSQISLPELAWCALAIAVLLSARPMDRWPVVASVCGTWILLTLLGWGLATYLSGVRS